MRIIDELVLVSRFSAALDHTPTSYLLDPEFEARMRYAVSDFAERYSIEVVEATRILKAARRAQLARRSIVYQKMEKAA